MPASLYPKASRSQNAFTVHLESVNCCASNRSQADEGCAVAAPLEMFIPALGSRVEKCDFLPGFGVKTRLKVQFEAVTAPASEAEIIERRLTAQRQSENVIYFHADDDDLRRLAILA